MDITLTEGPDGAALAHRPDCPVVLTLRALGQPLMTMFDVQAPLVELTCAKHSCLDRGDDQEGDR